MAVRTWKVTARNVRSGQRMGEQKKLNIAMLGDGDIIGTTKKNHVKSRLLVA